MKLKDDKEQTYPNEIPNIEKITIIDENNDKKHRLQKSVSDLSGHTGSSSEKIQDFEFLKK